MDIKENKFEGLENDDVTTFDEFDWNKINFLRANYDNLSTLENNWRIFRNYVHQYEVDFKKDLSMFKASEVVDLLDAIPTSSLRVKRTITSLLRLYNDWAINRGLNITANNVISSISSNEVDNVNVRKLKNKYFNEERMKKLVAKAEMKGVSPQHYIIPILAFVGLNGRGGEEIFNLRIEDVDIEKKIINVVDRENDKIIKRIKVSEWVMIQIEKAINFSQEVKENKRKKKNSKKEVVFNYCSTGYVVKPVGKKKSGTVSSTILRNRLLTVLDANNLKGISLNDFFKSAKFNLLLDILKSKDFLSSQDFKNVEAFFNGEDELYGTSWYNLKYDFTLCFPEAKIVTETRGRKNPLSLYKRKNKAKTLN